jgi:hypothetical protein
VPWAKLVDTGFRTEQRSADAEEMLVVGGEHVRAVDLGTGADAADSVVLRKAAEHVLATLVPFQVKFPDRDRMAVIEEYLQKRNSEEVLRDGFYIGCGDVCVATGAILEKHGYRCRLVHAVSSAFSESNDVGHVLLCVERGSKRYLCDPTMPGEIVEGYEPDSAGTLAVRSMTGDLFVFAVDRNPRRLGIHDMASLREARRAAFEHWKERR